MAKQRNAIYKTKQWAKVRKQVLELDHYECCRCNHSFFMSEEPKRLTRANYVHHIYPAKMFPQYIYQIYVNGHRNLVSLCFNCHEIIEGRVYSHKATYTNEERYD